MAQRKNYTYAQAKGAPAGFVTGLLAIASLARGVISATTTWKKEQDYYLNSLAGLVKVIAITNPVYVAFSRVAAAAVRATTTLTSDNTEPADGATITIGTTVYRFKNTPAQAYDVKRGGVSADADIGNLIKAINASGVGDGTDYYTGTLEHPDVVASTTITSHAFVISAKKFGTDGNAIATTQAGTSHFTFTGSVMAGGLAGNYDDYVPAGATKEFTLDDSISYLSFLGDGGTATVNVVEY